MKQKLTGPQQVAEFFARLDHPLKPSMLLVRETILAADHGITEHIKWNAPSFCYGGDDRVTFNIRNKDHLLLIFHRGAKVKDTKCVRHLVDDPTGLLDWPADDRATLRFSSLDDAENKSDLLTMIVRQWIKAAGDV